MRRRKNAIYRVLRRTCNFSTGNNFLLWLLSMHRIRRRVPFAKIMYIVSHCILVLLSNFWIVDVTN